jgi:phosphoglycerate dehydrogenase-like enzyme
MTWKVLITAAPISKVGQSAVAQLQSAGCELIHAVKPGVPFATDELTQLLQNMDAVLAGTEPYSATVLKSPAAARLKIISRWGVGFDTIDVSSATDLGIAVAFTPGLTDDAVADYTFALMLALARRVVESHISVRDGIWLPRWGNDLAGKTLGIVGFGRIGRAVARRAQGFHLRILAHEPTAKLGDIRDGMQFVSLDCLLAQSDFVTLHAALNPQSRGLIGEAQLRRMKPTAYLINAARGPLVDETALLRALNENWIAGAALDVYCEEPLPPRHPFRNAPNLLLSPHQASSTLETGERVSAAAVQAILDLMNGRPPQHLVNPQVLKSPNLRASTLSG